MNIIYVHWPLKKDSVISPVASPLSIWPEEKESHTHWASDGLDISSTDSVMILTVMPTLI
jgi:hypothetical protein